jgi:CDP-glycerol glycerophosphotransferase
MTALVTIQEIEKRVAALEHAAQQSVQMGQAFMGALQRDQQRMAMLESYRVVGQLSRAAHFHPKNRTVVFVGRGSFGDNVKYAFLEFLQVAQKHNVRTIFLPNNMPQYELVRGAGLPCVSPQPSDWTSADAKTLLSAAVTVIGDNFHPYSGVSPISYALLQGAKAIQLWHGIPLKEIGLNHMFSSGSGNVFLSELLASDGYYQTLVGHSTSAEHEWRQWFGFKDYAPIGYARNDVLYREPTAMDLLNVDTDTLRRMREARVAGKKVILYGPTFRDHKGPDWFVQSGFAAFGQWCQVKDHVLFINLHPFEQGATDELQKHYPFLNFIATGTDIYPLLRNIDLFITDYSSLAFDLLHRDCPMIFFRPDHAEYMARARALLPGREDYAPGDLVSTAKDLLVAVEKNLREDNFPAARKTLCQKLFDHADSHSAQRLCDVILKQLESIV